MSQAIAGLKPESLILNDFFDQAISICGKAFRAHMSGALYWPAEDALIVADLHLEKGSHFAKRGQMLPPYDTRETLRKLAEVIDAYDATTIISLGDSLHDAGALERMSLEDRETLSLILQDREWIWITGNHDGGSASALGGAVCEELKVEGITFRHEPRAGAAHTRNRRPHASGSAARDARHVAAAAMLRWQRPASRNARVRRLHGRPQRARRRLRTFVQQRWALRLDAWPGGLLSRRVPSFARRLRQHRSGAGLAE